MNEVILCNMRTVMEQCFCLNHLDVMVSSHSYVTSACLKILPSILYLHVCVCVYRSCRVSSLHNVDSYYSLRYGTSIEEYACREIKLEFHPCR